ncbi:hypothetical protein PRUPE_1G025900 [Prunus persica]|uniref:Uncharacterized protein n=1 Tax=Prunus persica TaxID=3760 RepID=A0A251QRV2_PRUPE|nr:hypothetical protein PRUPE_1G025900 [Prunus persica]
MALFNCMLATRDCHYKITHIEIVPTLLSKNPALLGLAPYLMLEWESESKNRALLGFAPNLMFELELANPATSSSEMLVLILAWPVLFTPNLLLASPFK